MDEVWLTSELLRMLEEQGSFEADPDRDDDEDACDDDVALVGVTTFEHAGVLTLNKGLVLRMSDGTEFQVTVVRSR